MAKIRKKNIYPIKPIPAREDYMPGTDAEDNNKTKSFTIGSIIDSTLLEAGLPSSTTGLLSVENITVTGEVATVTNAVWQIMGVEFTVTSQELPVNYAAEGLYRTDIIVGNGQGVLELIEGVESEDTTVQPTTPTGSVLIGILNVFGTDISPDIPAFNDIKLKPSEAWFKVADTGSVAQIEWGSQNAYRWFGGSDLTLHSLNISSDNTEYRYDGRMFFLCNATADKTITLKHQSETATGNVKFFMPDEEDIVINAGEIAGYRYYASSATTGQLELVISPNIGVDSVTGINVNNTDTSNPIVYSNYYDMRVGGVIPDSPDDQIDLVNSLMLDAQEAGYSIGYFPEGEYIFSKQVLRPKGFSILGVPGKTKFNFSGATHVSGDENGNFPFDACIADATTPELLGTLSAEAVQRNSTITLSTPVTLEQGDVIILYNNTDFSFSPERAYWKDGQFTTVRKAVTASTTVQITTSIIPTSLPIGTLVYKISKDPCFVKGIEIIGNYVEGVSTLSGTIRTGIRFNYVANGFLEDIEATNFPQAQVYASCCYNININKVLASKHDETPATSEWYGIVLGGCQDVKVSNSVIYTKRHNIICTRAAAFYYSGGVLMVSLVEIPNRFNKIFNNVLSQTFEDVSSRAIDFHGNSEHCVAYDNTVNGKVGFGGNNNAVINNKFFIPNGSNNANSYVFSAGVGKNIGAFIDGNEIEALSGDAFGLLMFQNIANYQTAEATLTFTNNKIKGLIGRAEFVNIYANNASSNGATKYNIVFENNTIDITDTTNNPVLSFAGDNAGRIKSLVIRDNKLTGVGIKADKVAELVVVDNTSVNAPKYGLYGTAITTATVTDNIFRAPNVVSGTALENSIIAFDNTTALYLDGNTGTAGTNTTNRLYLNTVTNYYKGINRLPGANSFTSVTNQLLFEGLNVNPIVVYCNTTPSATITGSTEQIIGSAALIPADTIGNGVLLMNALFSKAADLGTWVVKFYRNTTASLSGATQIAQCDAGNTINTFPLSREFGMNGTSMIGFPFTTNVLTSANLSGLSPSTATINNAADQYFFCTVTLTNASDVATLQYFSITYTPTT